MLINLPFNNFKISNLKNTFLIKFNEESLILFCCVGSETKLKNAVINEEIYSSINEKKNNPN